MDPRGLAWALRLEIQPQGTGEPARGTNQPVHLYGKHSSISFHVRGGHIICPWTMPPQG
jgi:hypothetical protein